MSEYILELKDVVKTFGGVKALNGVHFQLKRGEIHALMGENGAGKSTFIKVITGVHQPDSGIMLLDGEQVTLRNTTDSAKLGIAAIYQHVTAFPDLTVTENIFMGREIKNKFGFYDWKTMRQRAKELIQPLSAEIDVNKPMGNLSVAEQQLVEIAKALSCDARILIMDEPTAGLDVEARNEILDMLRAYIAEDESRSILITSHISTDLESLCDELYLIHDGKLILHEATDAILEQYGILKVSEEQYRTLDQSSILKVQKENYGYTNDKKFYQENYPQIAVENGGIDELILMMTGGYR